jgi:Fe-S-cluster containining protein
MNLIFAPNQNYECVKCSKGCVENWDIGVQPSVYKNVKGSTLELRVLQERGKPGQESFPVGPSGRTVGRVDGNRCIFLAEDKLCDIHREMGIDKKPAPCRLFPFVIKETPDGIVVGTTYFCTSAQQNSGVPLEEHRQEVTDILATYTPEKLGFGDIVIHHDVVMDWAGYQVLEKAVQAQLNTSVSGAFSRLVRAISIITKSGNTSPNAEQLAAAFESAPAADLHSDPMIAAQLDFFVGAVAGVLEVGKNVEHQRICHAFTRAESYDMPRLGYEVDFSQARMERSDIENDFSDEFVRYFNSLLFRKFLICERSLLEGAVLGYVAYRLLTLYTSLYAQKSGESPELVHLYKAMDLIEADLMTHVKGFEALISTMAQAVLTFLSFDEVPAV